MTGKLLILFLLLLFSSGFTKHPNGCLQIDIVLVADFSSSTEGKQKFVIGALDEFVSRFELSEVGIKVGVIAFNNYAYLVSSMTTAKDSLRSRIQELRGMYLYPSTNMTPALYYASVEFYKHGRQDYRKLMIVISDGAVNSALESDAIATDIKKMGIGICSVMINDSSSNPVFMRSISSDCYVETNYENLISELQKLDVCM